MKAQDVAEEAAKKAAPVWLDLLLICCWLLFGLVLESPRINCVKLKRRVHFVSCKRFVDENLKSSLH